ncbi:MAG: FkbM family methyltransferase [Rhizobiaceae bacterium]|nr:FkbM family methyltransferase [Rhizobiaceae bacterium]
MRHHHVEKVSFMGRSFLMGAIVDSWGVDDVVLAAIAKGNFGETDSLAWWLAMLERQGPSLFLDVGAYSGVYAMLAAATRGRHRTVAVEASVVTHGRLVQNILLNNFDLAIVPCHTAVSDSAGMVKLGHAFGVLSMASGESLVPDYETDHCELVPATSLDGLLLNHGPDSCGAILSRTANLLPVTSVGGIKIDVEGVETSVLAGASEIIARFKPPLIMEVLNSTKLAECEAILLPQGYRRVADCEALNFIFCHERDLENLAASHRRITDQGPLEITSETVISFAV